ncbi:putative DNA-directed DNA polymerase transcription factor Hap3/NF-YB family [Helianthus annuus]|nr:putative DNA-directed DNA polymerase transcription factor Hap3/NF-YB family [Helianthus annuus]KAJ0703293.1 putative DNA-directed DNA polymerase transcription factor Hap3/NF-YB family [Helianthus annuus]
MEPPTPTVVEKVVAEAEELPKAIVRRVVKDKLSQLSQNGADIQVLKDSLLAFSESARIFIHYLSATANDICKESKRQTINAEDVFKALEEIEFPEFIAPLRASLEEFKQKNAKRKSDSSKAKEAKKSKTEEEPVTENGESLENGESHENGDEDGNTVADEE